MKTFKTLLLIFCFIINIFSFPGQVFALDRVNLVLTYDGARHNYQNYAITLKVDNLTITELPMPPVIIEDRTYAPVKEIFTAIGAVVDWKDATKEVYIGYGDRMITLQIGNKLINNNGNIVSIPVAPRIINDKTMIPVRFAAEAFGFTVNWVDETKTVYVNTLGIDYPYQSPPVAPPTPDPLPPNIYEENPTADISSYKPAVVEKAVDTTKTTIAAMNYPETKITEIDVSGLNTYIIRASSEISRIEKFLLPDNRFVIDIYNAEMTLPKKVYALEDNPYLSTIRAGQNQTAPIKITRVVFDIQQAISFSVSLSSDRKSLAFSFEKNYFLGAELTSDKNYDYLRIDGVSAPVVSVYPLSNPERLVIDLPLCTMTSNLDKAVSGNFAYRLRSSQFQPEMARLVVDLQAEVSYSVTNEGNSTIIRMGEPTYRNIGYDARTKTFTLPLPQNAVFSVANIVERDLYNQYKYIISLPFDFTELIGFGDMIINDEYISSINISSSSGQTVLTINEKRVLAFNISSDGRNLYIKAVLPKEKYSRIIVVDPGHGGTDPGSSGNGLVEKHLNLDISNRLIALADAGGYVKIYATRVEDIYPDLASRTKFGNEIGDMYVAVHVNSYPANPLVSGTEVFYRKDTDVSIGGMSGELLSSIFQRNLVEILGTADRKNKSGQYIILSGTRIPAVICEIEFLSNTEGAQNLATESFRQLAAHALYRSILEAFSTYRPVR